MEFDRRDHIGPCELRYTRHKTHGPPHPPYGTRSKRGPRTVGAAPGFWTLCEGWMAHLAEVCPGGAPEIMATAGFQVSKGNARNAHRRGIAFDLDGLFWVGDEIAPVIALRADDDARRYLAVEAGLRQFFGVVLNWWWNKHHKCHFHVSAKGVAGWTVPRRVDQKTLFVQLALTKVLDRPVTLDAQWGPETRGAVEDVLMEVGPGALDLAAPGAWEAFCRAVELVGWGTVEAG
jgi:hypothetical protein